MTERSATQPATTQPATTQPTTTQLATGGPINPRAATTADVADIVAMVHELAAYERAPQECHLTGTQLHAALFAPHPSVFALVAEHQGRVGGFALYFLNFSTWEGVNGIYLEDLYVRPELRGAGLGRALLTELARLAVARGLARVDWSVLDWNEPSIAFYRALGAVALDEWTGFRLTGEALARVGAAPAGEAGR